MGRKNKFDKIERNETYYEAYGEEDTKKEKKKSKKNSILGLDKENVPEKTPLSSKFRYIREKKQPEESEETPFTEETVELDKPVLSPYVLTLIVATLAFALKILSVSGLLHNLVGKNSAVASAVMYAGVYLVPSVIFMIFTFSRMRFHNVKPFSPVYLPISFAFLGLVLSVTALQKYLIAYTFSYNEPTVVAYGGLVTGLFAGALLPALCEELFVHGIIQKEISEYAGGFAGILVSAFVFAMLHFELQYFFVYFFAAVIMGALTHITNSVFPAMLVHFLNNALSILFSKRLGFIATERIGGTLLIIVIAAVCFGFLILCLNIAEKLSEKKAYAASKDEENGKETKVEYFFSAEGRTLARMLNILKTPPMLVCYVLFIIAIVLGVL